MFGTQIRHQPGTAPTTSSRRASVTLLEESFDSLDLRSPPSSRMVQQSRRDRHAARKYEMETPGSSGADATRQRAALEADSQHGR